jgi:hypothetical protein
MKFLIFNFKVHDRKPFNAFMRLNTQYHYLVPEMEDQRSVLRQISTQFPLV